MRENAEQKGEVFVCGAGLAIKLKKLGTEVVGAGVFSVLSGSKIIGNQNVLRFEWKEYSYHK